MARDRIGVRPDLSAIATFYQGMIARSYAKYGDQPYKGTREAFQEYLAKRQAEDAQRRPGRS